MSVVDNADRRTGPTIVVTTPTGERKEFVLPKDPVLCKEEAFKAAMEILETPNIPARLFLSTVGWLQDNGYVEVSGMEGFEGVVEEAEVVE